MKKYQLNREDYIKLKDIKTLLKSNGFKKDNVSIRYIIQDVFESCEYKKKTIFKNRSTITNVFLYLQ